MPTYSNDRRPPRPRPPTGPLAVAARLPQPAPGRPGPRLTPADGGIPAPSHRASSPPAETDGARCRRSAAVLAAGLRSAAGPPRRDRGLRGRPGAGPVCSASGRPHRAGRVGSYRPSIARSARQAFQTPAGWDMLGLEDSRESRGERGPATAGPGIALRVSGLVTRSIRCPEDLMPGRDLEMIIEETQRLIAMSAEDAVLRGGVWPPTPRTSWRRPAILGPPRRPPWRSSPVTGPTAPRSPEKPSPPKRPSRPIRIEEESASMPRAGSGNR